MGANFIPRERAKTQLSGGSRTTTHDGAIASGSRRCSCIRMRCTKVVADLMSGRSNTKDAPRVALRKPIAGSPVFADHTAVGHTHGAAIQITPSPQVHKIKGVVKSQVPFQ